MLRLFVKRWITPLISLGKKLQADIQHLCDGPLSPFPAAVCPSLHTLKSSVWLLQLKPTPTIPTPLLSCVSMVYN